MFIQGRKEGGSGVSFLNKLSITCSTTVSISMRFADTVLSTTEGSLICIEGRKNIASRDGNLEEVKDEVVT